MCDCETVIPEKAGGVCFFSVIERFGYSLIRIKPFRVSDGLPSKNNRYEGIDWKFCPFCGERIKRGHTAIIQTHPDVYEHDRAVAVAQRDANHKWVVGVLWQAIKDSREGKDIDLPEDIYEIFCTVQNDVIAKNKLSEEAVIKAIDDELEFPGEMPAELWELAKRVVGENRPDAFAEYMRFIVRVTKQGIRDRIKAICQLQPTSATADKPVVLEKLTPEDLDQAIQEARAEVVKEITDYCYREISHHGYMLTVIKETDPESRRIEQAGITTLSRVIVQLGNQISGSPLSK